MGDSNSVEESPKADTDSPPSAAETEPSAPAPDTSSAPAEAAAKGEALPAADAKPKKKKKRKKEATAPSRDPLDADGRERPAFVLDYPSDPELDRLVRAFELGNYAFVREHAPEVAEKSSDAKVRAAASELVRRIEPDPLVKVLLGMSLALLFVLAFWAYKTHGN